MSDNILRIEVTFPVGVELSDSWQQRLISLVDEVCTAYELSHPGRVMWPFGVGSKITYLPLTREEELERGIELDDNTLSIEVAERERYHRWFMYVPLGHECCRDCGVVRRADNQNGPCRGKVHVALRDDAQA